MLALSIVNAWEINTHRAIDRKAIKESQTNGNLKAFIDNSRISEENYIDEKFEDYKRTYIDYILNGEENGISNDKWNQEFIEDYANYQDLIEAGSILGSTPLPFNLHFYHS